MNARCFRPVLGYSVRKLVISATYSSRPAVLHHAHKLRGCLPGIERNHQYAFGHHRQVQRRPANAVVSQQGAAVTFLHSSISQEGASGFHESEEFGASCALYLPRPDFLKDRAFRGLRQTLQYVLDKTHSITRNRLLFS